MVTIKNVYEEAYSEFIQNNKGKYYLFEMINKATEYAIDKVSKYEAEELKDRLIKSLLSTLSYDEMTEEQVKLVTEYETENWKKKVDVLKTSMSKEKLEEQIHEWWLDYQFTDGTEENLLNYI